MRIIILYDTTDGQTRAIADGLAAGFSPGHTVVVRTFAEAGRGLEISAFDLRILGAPIHRGAYARAVGKFIRRHAAALNAGPSAFFSVCLSAAGSPEEQHQAQQYINTLLEKCAWKPQRTVSFAGALRYRDYGPVKRWMVKKIMAERGQETDTSRNHEYTDWKQVAQFARACEKLAKHHRLRNAVTVSSS